MKENFINELAELLKENNIVQEMEYQNDGFDETITIVKDGTTRIVNVTYDSKEAMLRDIIRQGGLD